MSQNFSITECKICFEPLESGQQIYYPCSNEPGSNCGHPYHFNCLERWIHSCPTRDLNMRHVPAPCCPLCKFNFTQIVSNYGSVKFDIILFRNEERDIDGNAHDDVILIENSEEDNIEVEVLETNEIHRDHLSRSQSSGETEGDESHAILVEIGTVETENEHSVTESHGHEIRTDPSVQITDLGDPSDIAEVEERSTEIEEVNEVINNHDQEGEREILDATSEDRLFHENGHTSTSLMKCRICDKQFRTYSGRSRHETSHKKKFECKVCKKFYTTMWSFKRHQKQFSHYH